MNDLVIDSSVVAKWILPEADSAKAHELITRTAANGGQLIVLDLVFPEVANAIWKRQRQKLITLDEARAFLNSLAQIPVHVDAAAARLASAFEIAAEHDRAIYDALFVSLAHERNVPGITADEPLHNSIHAAYPQIVLLRDYV